MPEIDPYWYIPDGEYSDKNRFDILDCEDPNFTDVAYEIMVYLCDNRGMNEERARDLILESYVTGLTKRETYELMFEILLENYMQKEEV